MPSHLTRILNMKNICLILVPCFQWELSKKYIFLSPKKSVLTSIATPVKHTPTHKQVPPWCEDENKEYFFVHCSLKGCVCVASSLWDVYSPCALVVWITKTVLMTNKGFGH